MLKKLGCGEELKKVADSKKAGVVVRSSWKDPPLRKPDVLSVYEQFPKNVLKHWEGPRTTVKSTLGVCRTIPIQPQSKSKSAPRW